MPVYPEIFEVSIGLQRASTELSIFCREASSAVEIAYPICRYTVVCVVPNGLQAWCVCRNVIWECFCALVTDEHVPVCFSSNDMHHSTALCHHNPSQCGFLLNLNEARHTAELESTYRHILTQGQNGSLHLTMPRLLRTFQRQLAAIPFGHAQLMPYFEGYCGSPRLRSLLGAGPVRSHTTAHPSHRHCSGMGRMGRPMHQQQITNYVRHASVALGEAANHRGTPNHHGDLSAADADILQTLAAGGGISRYAEIGLLEECNSCRLRFAGSALRAHIPTCMFLL
ncbi:uncharacterized protein HD556DRAFT_1447871 [Suillus plorans]|uniref:Uncharacterized protein n=1 Tax=Suillus plorans TaxID=116603 RepID=A0A9P7AGS7_9AGAM|nr:uncharacterized protein HD556DRAFT_1447871 [Suillus plorans]KAG1788473.1 hypothetical protein HD556DRAFT_1447871 [Suillus plorans]